MASKLSSNWKKLQATLKQESNNSREFKRKKKPTREQNPTTKRRRIETHCAGIPAPLTGFSHKQTIMGSVSSAVEKTTDPAPSESLLLWAEENDISTRDLAEAYGPGLQDTFVQGASTDKVNAGLLTDVEIGKYVAMDCEMVGVGGKEGHSVVARVSIVNFHGTQVYDSFVRPKEFVTDWRTHVSGVSPKNMATARPFDEVRDEVARLLKNRILVGHAIKHDLDVMMLGHPNIEIRDTSKFSGFRKYSSGKTPSLKKLVKEVLGVDIQQGQHSSIEDARATMLLFRRHKQSFDAEIASKFPPRKPNGAGDRSRSKRKKRKR